MSQPSYKYITGIVYDQGAISRKPAYVQNPALQKYLLSQHDLETLVPMAVGLPIMVEHRSRPVGVVTKSIIKSPGVWQISATIDPNQSLMHMAAAESISTGKLRQLSLSHNPMTMRPVEITLCGYGARPGCDMWEVDYKGNISNVAIKQKFDKIVSLKKFVQTQQQHRVANMEDTKEMEPPKSADADTTAAAETSIPTSTAATSQSNQASEEMSEDADENFEEMITSVCDTLGKTNVIDTAARSRVLNIMKQATEMQAELIKVTGDLKLEKEKTSADFQGIKDLLGVAIGEAGMSTTEDVDNQLNALAHVMVDTVEGNRNLMTALVEGSRRLVHAGVSSMNPPATNSPHIQPVTSNVTKKDLVMIQEIRKLINRKQLATSHQTDRRSGKRERLIEASHFAVKRQRYQPQSHSTAPVPQHHTQGHSLQSPTNIQRPLISPNVRKMLDDLGRVEDIAYGKAKPT